MLNGDFLLQPILVANILFVLSFFAAYDERRIAILTLAVSVVVLIGAVRFYLDGRYSLAWSITEFVVYGYLGINALVRVRADR